jgi:hypothetical protein
MVSGLMLGNLRIINRKIFRISSKASSLENGAN